MPRRKSNPPSPPSLPFDPTTTQVLTENQAAQLLGVHPRSLSKMRCESRGPAYCHVGRHIRYFLTDIISWLQSSRVPCDSK